MLDTTSTEAARLRTQLLAQATAHTAEIRGYREQADRDLSALVTAQLEVDRLAEVNAAQAAEIAQLRQRCDTQQLELDNNARRNAWAAPIDGDEGEPVPSDLDVAFDRAAANADHRSRTRQRRPGRLRPDRRLSLVGRGHGWRRVRARRRAGQRSHVGPLAGGWLLAMTKRKGTPGVSISGATYERLSRRVRRQPGERGRVSRTVDKLINDYLDQQAAGVLQPPKTSAEVA